MGLSPAHLQRSGSVKGPEEKKEYELCFFISQESCGWLFASKRNSLIASKFYEGDLCIGYYVCCCKLGIDYVKVEMIFMSARHTDAIIPARMPVHWSALCSPQAGPFAQPH